MAKHGQGSAEIEGADGGRISAAADDAFGWTLSRARLFVANDNKRRGAPWAQIGLVALAGLTAAGLIFAILR